MENEEKQNSPVGNEEDMWRGLVWDLYQEHITKFSHAMVRGMPSSDKMKEQTLSIMPDATVKVLALEKIGMTLLFHHMATYRAGDVATLHKDQVKEFLSQRFGGGKFKLNLYHGVNFMATKNYKTEGPPTWKDRIGKDPATTV